MIDVKNITVGYGKNIVLNDLSVSFAPGELTSVIGVNGSGKSTLLKAILGMIPLNCGEIMIDSASLRDMTRNQIARAAAYLAQGNNTPDMTVEQLVLHGRFPHLNYPRRYSKRDYEIAFAAMEQVGISESAQKPLHELSGGMRQNAYIAMALAQETDYILLDEPTTYLDISHQLALMKTLRALAEHGKGVICVMHDLPMALTFSDRVVVLNNGQVVGSGEPEQVAEQKIIDRVFGVSVDISARGMYSYKY